MGFFGPIGVSAIFYLYISLEFLETITSDGLQREDARKLGEVLTVVIWFLAICSNVRQVDAFELGLHAKYFNRLSMD
jgi:sodium/hydrogen antiporter